MYRIKKVFKLKIIFLGLLITGLACNPSQKKSSGTISNSDKKNNQKELSINIMDSNPSQHIIILGIAQDAGYPQANCKKDCCTELWSDKSKRKMVSCIGLRDPKSKKVWMFDATPDFKDQLKLLLKDEYELAGIFLTHAHMGHYTGLMHLGREAMGSKSIPLYVMPRMKTYLETNGPWSQLVELKNIEIIPLNNGVDISLENSLNVIPFLVPHRDEFSETVGFNIKSSNTSSIFIPDIDKWDKWTTDINEKVKEVDYAFLDGTFYKNGEIWGRDMSQIPHPFIQESMARFSSLTIEEKEKIRFIHLNHTNPLLNNLSSESKEFASSGFNIAKELEIYKL